MKTNYFDKLLISTAQRVEKKLESYLSGDGKLLELMSYSLLSGGKRIRPFLVIEASKLFGGSEEKALPFACALEMIHTYSLIHDDLPCMDNDDYRRGRLTSHKVFGEANALLAGDSLLTYAFEVITDNPYVSDKSIKLATKCLSSYAGYKGMCGGQYLDLNGESNIKIYDDLIKMHSLKTGALIKCAVILGYLSATDDVDEQIIADLEKYAQNIGLAFQIKDDILDKTADSTILGKLAGSDEKNGKITSLSFMSISDAEKEVNRLTNEAIDVIEKYYKTEQMNLVQLANYMVNRIK